MTDNARHLVHVECNCDDAPCGWAHHAYEQPEDARERCHADCDCTLSIPAIKAAETR